MLALKQNRRCPSKLTNSERNVFPKGVNQLELNEHLLKNRSLKLFLG